MPTVTREEILTRIKELAENIVHEDAQCAEIRRSPEYQAAEADLQENENAVRELVQEGSELRTRMNEMTAAVPDSRVALTEAKQELIRLMQLEGVEGYTEDWIIATGKWSEKKSVDGRRLLEVLDGDIDEFTKLAKPTQKSVTELAKERPELKKALLGCIKLESRDLVDVEIQFPEIQ